MAYRAKPSGVRLTEADAATIKGMLARGDRQHDIAAWFGVNGGRIAEVATGRTFGSIVATPVSNLPPPGPYPAATDAYAALSALRTAKQAIVAAEAMVSVHLR
ncbi:hypothetical protein [Novosphingobium humi]|uniref:Transposase IS30-like HTH domain-containing protein n=1 Tax=Novosphingobium humi TaxID=2282397 RepID=A0ABY7U0Y7_9SPHN|nr:hypothetical protein [Novosphingobium humi]WCT77754.1 hypothetical protein PQ457_01890 [Novosphingobium humi]